MALVIIYVILLYYKTSLHTGSPPGGGLVSEAMFVGKIKYVGYA